MERGWVRRARVRCELTVWACVQGTGVQCRPKALSAQPCSSCRSRSSGAAVSAQVAVQRDSGCHGAAGQPGRAAGAVSALSAQPRPLGRRRWRIRWVILTGASEFYLTGAMLFISCFSSSWCKYCSPNLKTTQTKNPPPPKIPKIHHLQAQEPKEAFQKFRELFFLSLERHCQSFATAK